MTDRELETRLEVDVHRNLQNAPGVRVWRAGTNDSGVSANNRVLERHLSRYGAYWKSYDFAGSVGTQNIVTHPLNFTHDGGEVIFNLPNGLQGYYIANASGFRLDVAPIDIVSNPAASDPTVRTGLSCFGCHIEGMNTFEDQVRSVIESTANPTYDKAQALRLYVEKPDMDALVQEDIDRYRQALEETGGTFGDIEPISRFHEAYQGPVDAAYAAAVVGLEAEAFLERIRENLGLQNIGLLVLESDNGSMKRDAWRSNFPAIIYALDFPEAEIDSPSQPEVLPGAVIHIPDTNLRAAIAEALGKSPNAPITAEVMEQLTELYIRNRGIRDLTGLQFATNLNKLYLRDNQISDLSPIARLINLRELRIDDNPVSDLFPVRGLENLTKLELEDTLVSDLSPLKNLKNLTHLWFRDTHVSDLSPVAELINLKFIGAGGNPIPDLSPIAGLTKLEEMRFGGIQVSNLEPLAGLTALKTLYFSGNRISDISPLAGLTELHNMNFSHNYISDISPLAGLTSLKWLALDTFGHGEISDLTPLAGLTALKELYMTGNDISDISPLVGLTGLTRLNLENNNISDISPLAGLTNLEWLNVGRNQISNFSSLAGLRADDLKLVWHGNPGFPKGGPKIEGPWLWVVLPDTELNSDTDFLSEASGGTVTEVEVSTHGAIAGQSVGGDVWTSHKILPTGGDNIEDALKHSIGDGVTYGTVSLYSPREQETTMYVGSDHGLKVWLNGTLIYKLFDHRASKDYNDFFPVTLQQGRNILLIAVSSHGNGFFGFEPGTDYTVSTGVGYTFSQTPIHTGDTFTLNIRAENVSNFAGWQFDITFDSSILEVIHVTEGNFLKTDGGSTFFQDGSIDSAAGKITGLSAARLSTQGVNGTGVLLQVQFKARSAGETRLTLDKFEFGTGTGEILSAGPHEIRIVVEESLLTGDVNRDGRVSILDLILVAQQLGNKVPAGSAVDVNGDGVVSVLDLIRVAQGIAGSPAAPIALNPDRIGAAGAESVDAATIEAWIAQARLEDDGSLAFKQGIENLQTLLASLTPEETALHRNYPNPFNPETWIPYQLANPAEVTLTIYDMNGQLVRRLKLGHQAAGIYRSRTRALYWDGRNQLGEPVATGLYFYTLTAKDFTATRKMLILK